MKIDNMQKFLYTRLQFEREIIVIFSLKYGNMHVQNSMLEIIQFDMRMSDSGFNLQPLAIRLSSFMPMLHILDLQTANR